MLMPASTGRYGDGRLKHSQDAANSRYRQRQRALRTWVDDVADGLGVTREQLIRNPGSQVAEILRTHYPAD